MGSKTYTQHKLTDPMLQRLSEASKPGGTFRGGVSMVSLEERGLVRVGALYHSQRRKVATEAGRQALAQARAEGW